VIRLPSVAVQRPVGGLVDVMTSISLCYVWGVNTFLSFALQ